MQTHSRNCPSNKLQFCETVEGKRSVVRKGEDEKEIFFF